LLAFLVGLILVSVVLSVRRLDAGIDPFARAASPNRISGRSDLARALRKGLYQRKAMLVSYLHEIELVLSRLSRGGMLTTRPIRTKRT